MIDELSLNSHTRAPASQGTSDTRRFLSHAAAGLARFDAFTLLLFGDHLRQAQ